MIRKGEDENEDEKTTTTTKARRLGDEDAKDNVHDDEDSSIDVSYEALRRMINKRKCCEEDLFRNTYQVSYTFLPCSF